MNNCLRFKLSLLIIRWSAPKVSGLQVYNFIKKRLQHRYISVKCAKFLRTPFLTEHFGGCYWKCLFLKKILKKILRHVGKNKKRLCIHTFFYKQHFYKERQAEINKKLKQMLSNTLRLNLWINHIFHPPYHPKIRGHILNNKQKSKCVSIHEIIRSITMKMKSRSHRYNIRRPSSGHGHKFSKHKKCLGMVMLICIK